jgi:DNA-binding MarR family transcriptional regulator
VTKVIADRKKLSSNHQLHDSEGEELHLPVSVWLRLMKCHNIISRELRKQVERDGLITLPQFDVLVQLSRQSEGLSFVELSRKLLVTSGNLTGIIDRLERDSLVSREPDSSDRRVVRIRLTSKGKDLISRLIPEHVKQIETVFTRISNKDLRQLRGLLGKLRTVLPDSSGI